jgi:hypothetical protein
MKVRIINLAFAVMVVLGSLFGHTSAYAAASTSVIQQQTQGIQESFQDELFKASKNTNQDLSALIPLMAVLMVINIFSSLYKGGPDRVLIDMAKMSFWAFIAACVMGGSFYATTGIGRMFSINTTVCNKEYVYNGGGSLDRDLINFFKYSTDELACGLYGADVNTQYNKAVADLFSIVGDLNSMPDKCMALAKNATTAQDSAAIVNCIREYKVEKDAASTAQCSAGGWSGVQCSLQQLIDFVLSLNSPVTYVKMILFLVEMFVQVVQFLLMFAMIIGIAGSLLMFKLISPFFVLEDVRGRVLSAAKVPLAVALYGFTQKTLLFFLTGLIGSVRDASLVSVAKYIQGGALINAGGILYIFLMVSFACIAILVMQIVIIMKVPKLSLALVNLSLQELVNVGGEMIKAAFGAIGAVAATGVGAGALMAARVGTGAAAGAAGSAFGGASNGLRGMLGSRFGMNRPGGGSSPGSPTGGGNGGQGGAAALQLPSSTGPGAQSPTEPSLSVVPSAPNNTQYPSDTSIPQKKDAATPSESGSAAKVIEINSPKVVVNHGGLVNHVPSAVESKPTPGGPISAGTPSESAAESAGVSTSPTGAAAPVGVGMSVPGGVPASTDAPVSVSDGDLPLPDNSNAPTNPESTSPVRAHARARRASKAASDSAKSSSSGQKSSTEEQKEELSQATTLEEYESIKNKHEGDKSKGAQQKRKFNDSVKGAFGSSAGRKALALSAMSAGANFASSIMSSALEGPGSELNVTGAIREGSLPMESALADGEKRYSEFRNMVEGKEKASKEGAIKAERDAAAPTRERNALTEESLSKADESVERNADLMTSEEIEKRMSDLDGVIAQVLDEQSQEDILKAASHPALRDHAEFQAKYELALSSNAEFKAKAEEINENSKLFIETLNFMVGRDSLSANDVKNLAGVLALSVNGSAMDLYDKHRTRLQSLMRAQNLGDLNKKKD